MIPEELGLATYDIVHLRLWYKSINNVPSVYNPINSRRY